VEILGKDRGIEEGGDEDERREEIQRKQRGRNRGN